jgi:hypothetical protein
MKTRIEVYLESKTKKEIGYPNQPSQKPSYELKFNVGYDQTSQYYQLSGGSQPVFHTANEDVANSMEVGKKYAIEISPVE